MKRFGGTLFLISLLVTMFCERSPDTRVLVVTGGHDFEQKQFYAMFDSFKNMVYDSVAQPKANILYTIDDMSQYDVLVFYDMFQKINAEQKQAFLDILEQGKGIVFLHHALASYQDWDQYADIVGGRFILESDKDSVQASTYKHDVNVNVHIMNPDHPVTQGVEDFVIRDEVYDRIDVSNRVHPLLSTDHPESGEIIGWHQNRENSRIVYIQLGHDHHAYENPNYRQLVRQAVQWVKESASVHQ